MGNESEPKRIGLIPRLTLGTTLAISSAIAVDTATHHNTANAQDGGQSSSQGNAAHTKEKGRDGYLNQDGTGDFPMWTLAVLAGTSLTLVAGGFIIRRNPK